MEGPQIPKFNKPEKLEKFEKAPEGWKTYSSLAGELNVGQPAIKKIAERYHESNQEYFKNYEKRGRIFEYYSPELTKIIREEIKKNKEETPFSPEGWETSTSLANEIKVAQKTIANIANQYRQSNPEYFGKFRNKKGRAGLVNEFYSPELVRIITEEIEKVEKAPEGWMTNKRISEGLDVDFETTEKIAKKYRDINPGYFNVFRDSKGRIRNYYSPELVRIITEEIKKIKETPGAPKGWMTTWDLNRYLNSNQIQAHQFTINKIAEQYKANHPEYFNQFKGNRNRLLAYYSPELVRIITEEIKKIKEIPYAPEGWMTNGNLFLGLKVAQQTVSNIANQYRQSNPEYFGKFRNKKGRAGLVNEFYSPELVRIITEEIEKVEKAPEGWMTKTSLSKQLNNVDPKIISLISKTYYKTNPEYFKEYKNKSGKISEYYSPELVKIITEEVQKLEKYPIWWKKNKDIPKELIERDISEGWETLAEISTRLNISESTIQNIIKQYQQSNPEYFIRSRKKNKKLTQYYSPELISIITEKLKKSIESPYSPKGWETSTNISDMVNVSHGLVIKIANPYKKTNPEYFKEYKIKGGQIYEFYSPELVRIITEEIEKVEKAPEGWMTNGELFRTLDTSQFLVAKIANPYKKTNPEYFKEYKIKGGQIYEFYSPELVRIITEEIKKIKETPSVPEGWVTNSNLAKKFNVAQPTVADIANKYRKTNAGYFKMYKHEKGSVHEFYSPELVRIITEEIEKVEKAPEGWATAGELTKRLLAGYPFILNISQQYKETNPEYFKEYKNKSGQLYEHYSPELVEIIIKEVEKLKEIPYAPEGWITAGGLSKKLKVTDATILKIANQYREISSQYFKDYKSQGGQIFEFYSPELVRIITEEIEKVEKAPEGWSVNTALAIKFDVTQVAVTKIAQKYRETNPEYFRFLKPKRGPVREFYSPELVEIIKNELAGPIESKRIKSEEERLKGDLDNLAEEIASGETEKGRRLMEIIRLLPGNAHDIILRHHPEFKGMSVAYVKSVVAEYLGDFIVTRKDWQPADIEKTKDLIGVENIRETILLNLKNSCLSFVNKERKNDPSKDEFYFVEKYFEQPEIVKASSSKIKEIEDALSDIRDYYKKLSQLREKKPGNIVEKLKEGRVFPDINQLLNIQEIKEKNRMLIADEMGLGKSASAILTKEYLGLGTALVVMPSNVEDTWRNYLSDKINEDGKQLGYFKAGLTPKVLVIESPKDIEKLKTKSFDYILISQEKISGEHYEEALQGVNFDMMIIDEIHKLKNIESGVRSESVVRLADKVKGENKYLALLSGTPVPNKVKDIAITLKLLYPEKYKEIEDKELVRQIIHGDLIDLRSELLPRMQMKELQTSIEIPPLEERDIEVEMSKEEREIYEILLEEDELTASEKIILFRQFLLNPELLRLEPGLIGSKVQELKKTLQEDLKTKDKIIVFVNGYIEGVIRGDSNIIEKMNLPPSIVIEEIHGEIDKSERNRIENELKSSNKKMVVFVSGQTADVGVDFSGAEEVIFSNEPWSKYEKWQQLARVYREGLKQSLVSKTLITKDSMEEGIRRYINAKEKAIEKLFRGIPRTEAENKLLLNDTEKLTRSNDVETNAELSRDYMSDWDKLMIHFGQGLFAGEKRFLEELPVKGKEYAMLYQKLGKLTYQGNNARVTATILEKMISKKEEDPGRLRIIDMASGPEMLKQAVTDKLKGRIFSLDINPEHFAYSSEPRKTLESSYLSIPANNDSVDYYNMGFAFHQTKPIKYYKKNYERLQVLTEMNRVLKPGGRATISMLYNVKFTNPDKFSELIGRLGFKFVENYTGEVDGGVNYKAGFYTLEKVNNISEYKNITFGSSREEKEKQTLELAEKLGRDVLDGLEMDRVEGKLKDQRRMIEKVKIGDKEIDLILNDKDRELLEKEKEAIKNGEALKLKYGGIAGIPLAEIKKIGFERKLQTPGYYILYKLVEGGGAVIIRGDYKPKNVKTVE